MKQLYWNEKFEIGIPELDEQHQSLVELINQLAKSLARSDSSDQIRSLANQLSTYVALHFRDEEEVMMQCATMPESEKRYHFEQHELFSQHLNELIDVADLGNASFGKDLLDYVSTWLISHILGSDRRLANYCRMDQSQHVEIHDAEAMSVSETERILLAALNESERRFRLFSDQSATMIWISDHQGDRNYFNQAWQDYVRDESSLLKGAWQQHIHPDDLQGYLGYLDELRQKKHSGEREYRIRSATGEYRFFYERIMPRFELDHSFIGLTGSAVDVTHLKEAEILLSRNNAVLEDEVRQRRTEIQKLMQLDPLTEVANKDYVLAQLEAELKRAKRHQRPLSLMFVQIDDFRQIKADLGYDRSDAIFKKIAQDINQRIRESDVFGRFSVENFLAVLPETSGMDAVSFAEQIMESADILEYETGKQLTLSIGVAETKPTDSSYEWINRAFDAMTEASGRGGNLIVAG